MYLNTDTPASAPRFVPPLFQDISQINFDAAALWRQQEVPHLRKLLAAAEALGVARPGLVENAGGVTPESRQEITQWLRGLPLNRLCRERPEACRVFMDAVQSVHEAYRMQAGHSTTRHFLQYTLNVLQGSLNPRPEDVAVGKRADLLETQYLNQLEPRERQSFALAQRAADRSMDEEVTKGYGDMKFHEQHPQFWRHLTIIRRIRNMARDVMEDARTIAMPKVLPMGRDLVPIATRHPTYRLTEPQRACASQLRLILEGEPVDPARAIELMNGMVGKELTKPTSMDEMKMTAADAKNDFSAQLDRLRESHSDHHFQKLTKLSPDMFVWPAFDQDVDAPEKLTCCMEVLSCMMRKSKWDVIVGELKLSGASPGLIARAEHTRDYWARGVAWWEANQQAEANRRNKVIRSNEPIDASLVDVTQHPDYPRLGAEKIGHSEKASDERDELLALLAAEKNPKLAPLAKLVEIKNLGANGEFRISGTGSRGFLEPGPDGKLQLKPNAMRLLEERRWEIARLAGGDISRIIIAEYAEGTWRALHDAFDKWGLPLQLGPNHRPDGVPFTPLAEAAQNVQECINETDRMLQHTPQISTMNKAGAEMDLSNKIAGSDYPKRNGQVSKVHAQMQMQKDNDRLQTLYPRARISMRLGAGETVMRTGGPNGYRDTQAGLLHMPASGAKGEPRSTVAVTVQGVGMDRAFITPMAALASRMRFEQRSLHAFDDTAKLDSMMEFAADLDTYVGGLQPRLCDDPAYETLLVDNELVTRLAQREVGGARGLDPAEPFKGPQKMRTIRVSRTYQDTGMLSWYNNLLDVPKELLDRIAADARKGGRFGTWYVASLFHEAAQADPSLLRFVVGHNGGLAGEAHREKKRVVDTLDKAHGHLCDWLRAEGFALIDPDDILIAAPGPLLTQQVEALGLHPQADYKAIENAMRQQRLERRCVAELAAMKPTTAPDQSGLADDRTDFIAKLQATHRLYNSTDGEG